MACDNAVKHPIAAVLARHPGFHCPVVLLEIRGPAAVRTQRIINSSAHLQLLYFGLSLTLAASLVPQGSEHRPRQLLRRPQAPPYQTRVSLLGS